MQLRHSTNGPSITIGIKNPVFIIIYNKIPRNSFSHQAIAESVQDKKKFWEEDDGMWDTINAVGLR